jgi:predicted lipoprotein
VLLGLALAWTGCRRLPSRAEVLAALGREVVLPSYRRLAASSAALAAAARELRAHPDQASLLAARHAWREALAALAFTGPLREGPAAEQRLHVRADYWPVRPAAIDALAARPIDATTLREAGAAVKGLFAIEYLLFESRAAVEGRWRVLVLLADDVHQTAAAVDQSARREDLPAALAARGQEGVALLVNGLVETVETARAALVAPALDRPAPAVVLLPGARGGAIRELALARLEGVAAHYRGLSALVAAVSPSIDRTVARALAAARATVTPELCRALEIALKTELTGALGVTLTFPSFDGD